MNDDSATQDASPSPTTSDPLIAELARSIRELDRVTGIDLAYEVGQLVLDHLYEGDRQRLRARQPDDAPLCQLSNDPQLGLGRRGLDRVVSVFELIADLGGPDACKHVGADHIRAVLGLVEPGRRELLELAESHRWSVTELEHAVRVMASQRPSPKPTSRAAASGPSGPPRLADRASQVAA